MKYKLFFFLIAKGTDFSIGEVIGVCVGGLVLILIILMIYFICSRKSQNINATATAVHLNDIEVGMSGPLKELDQTSAFNMEDIYSSETKIDSTTPSIPPPPPWVSGWDFNSSQSEANHEYVIGENKRMQAKNEQIRLAKQRRSDNTTPSIPPPPPWVSGW
jgi:hypothetical protein